MFIFFYRAIKNASFSNTFHLLSYPLNDKTALGCHIYDYIYVTLSLRTSWYRK